jgi:predicted amino acid dehydrogenase
MDVQEKTKFAFIVNRMPGLYFHKSNRFPFNMYPLFAGKFWNEQLDNILSYPVEEVTSATQKSCLGKVFLVPLTQEQMIQDQMQAVEAIKKACDDAEEWGAEMIGLGGVSAVVGSRGKEIDLHTSAAVTTGFSYTIHTSIQALEKAASALAIKLEEQEVVILLFPGSNASAIAEIMAQKGCNLILVGRIRARPVQIFAQKLRDAYGVKVELKDSIEEGVRAGRIILSSTTTGDIIDQAWLLPGSIVIDVGLPKDVIGRKPARSDVLILDGGYVSLPGKIPFIFRLISFFTGIGTDNVLACLAETILMALENKKESLSIGRNLDIDMIKEIGQLAEKHGFSVNNLRSFDRQVNKKTFDRLREVITQ